MTSCIKVLDFMLVVLPEPIQLRWTFQPHSGSRNPTFAFLEHQIVLKILKFEMIRSLMIRFVQIYFFRDKLLFLNKSLLFIDLS